MKRARRYCQCCGAHSHVTNECWNLPSNANKRPDELAVLDAVLDAAQSKEQSKGEESEKLVQSGNAD